MAKLLLNPDGKVLTSNDKVLKAPEGANPLQTLVTGKGADAGYYLFHGYKGDNVDFISDIDFSTNQTCNDMFGNCSNLQTIPLFDTSNVTNMYNMFTYCTNLQNIPQLNTNKVIVMCATFSRCNTLQTIPQLDTGNVTDMSAMFSQCGNFQTFPPLDTSKVTNMQDMFKKCYKLQEVPQLDTSSVTKIDGMFYDCRKLSTIDLTSLDKVTSTSYISNFAYNCYSLTKLIIRTMTVIPPLNTNSFNKCHHFLGTVDATYNPDGLKDGRIYIPDDKVEELKQATNWSAYADIIVPKSTLVEE